MSGSHGSRRRAIGFRDCSTNGVRLYDGNSAVASALANGEIEVGLTDTDDVWAAQREHAPVDFVYESVDKPPAPGMNAPKGLPSIGPLVIPNTVGKILACPHPNEAGKLADFLLSSTVESMLAESESRNIPIRPELAKKFDRQTVTNPAQVAARQVDEALPHAEKADHTSCSRSKSRHGSTGPWFGVPLPGPGLRLGAPNPITDRGERP